MESLQRLRVLCEVAKRGSFTAAATALYLSQPAVSQHMSALERELGMQLIDRAVTGARLTAAGEVALRHAMRILQAADTARRELDALRSGRPAPIRVAAFATACTQLVPAAARSLRNCHPDVEFELVECDTAEALDRVRQSAADLAVAFDYAAHSLDTRGLVTRHLADDPVHLAVPHRHPAARTAVVDVDALIDEPWIGGSGFACRESLQTVCGAAGFAPRIALDSNRYPTTLALVGAGHGLALVPESALKSPPQGVSIRPLRPSPPPRRVWAVTMYEPNRQLTDLIDALAAVLQDGHRGLSDAVHIPAEHRTG